MVPARRHCNSRVFILPLSLCLCNSPQHGVHFSDVTTPHITAYILQQNVVDKQKLFGKIALVICCFCRNYPGLHERTKQLEDDNEKMEQQLKELKIAMGKEKAQREYGCYCFF